MMVMYLQQNALLKAVKRAHPAGITEEEWRENRTPNRRKPSKKPESDVSGTVLVSLRAKRLKCATTEFVSCSFFVVQVITPPNDDLGLTSAIMVRADNARRMCHGVVIWLLAC